MLLLSGSFYADAATITSTTTGGNWNDGTTWVGGSKPGSSDDVVIAQSAVVLMDAANVSSGIISLTVSANATLSLNTAIANNLKFNIKGNIINNGKINFWLSSVQGMSLYLLGNNSNWSGSGSWNLAQLVVGNSMLEFDDGLSITSNRTITVSGGSINSTNKRSNITFTFSGPENQTVATGSATVYYGNITLNKSNSAYVQFAANSAVAATTINILGDINLNYGNELKINTNNILDIKSLLSGSGTITGSTSSDVTISGNGAAFIFNSGGSGFRNFTVSRPNGVSIDSTITIYETLSLQNKAKLYLPAGKAANKNFSFSVGQTTSTGAITGDGYLAQPAADNIYQLADVTINGTAADVPLRFSQTGSENIIHNFTINKSSGNVNLVDGETLQIRNTFIITNGNLAINTGTLKLTGSIKTGTTSTLSGSANANLFIGNDAASLSATLYFNQDKPANHLLATYIQNRNGTITLGNALSVNQLVDVGSDNAANILNSASNLTLVSDEYTTARVANFYAASITDSVMVQRFIKGGDNSRRSYRLLSSPVYQVANARPGLARYYFSRLQDSILITGAGGVSKGFDASPVNGPTIWKYNETNATSAGTDFIPISSINKLHDNSSQDQLTAGNGFLLFFRGDRSHNVSQKTTPPFATPESVVLNYKGLLNQGDITVTAPFGAGNANLSYTNRAEENDGFNLMGNPYASTIDWELSGSNGAAISLTNVNPTIYILDPVTKNYGTYTRGGVNTGKATRYISSGQGFFVKANGANPALTFTEAAKVSQNTNPAVLSANKPTDFDFIRLSLSKDSVNKDDILLTFKIGQQQKFINNEDIADLQGINAAVSLSSLISANNGFLAVNGLPPVDKTIIIPLNIDAAAAGVLNLSLDTASAVFKTRHVYLRDKFLKDSVDLNLTSIYTFSISKTDSATFGSKRFEIYFHDNLPDKNSITIGNTVSTPVINPAQIRLFPNPASAEINIIPGKQSIKNIKLSIYNVLGIKKLTSVHSGLANFKQNIAALIPGIYVAELTDLSSGIVIQQLKFIKK